MDFPLLIILAFVVWGAALVLTCCFAVRYRRTTAEIERQRVYATLRRRREQQVENSPTTPAPVHRIEDSMREILAEERRRTESRSVVVTTRGSEVPRRNINVGSSRQIAGAASSRTARRGPESEELQEARAGWACAICLETFQKEMVHARECGHQMHQNCYKRVAAIGASDQCPACAGFYQSRGGSAQVSGGPTFPRNISSATRPSETGNAEKTVDVVCSG